MRGNVPRSMGRKKFPGILLKYLRINLTTESPECRERGVVSSWYISLSALAELSGKNTPKP